MNGLFSNGTNGCGCNSCDIVLLVLLLNCLGGCGGGVMGGCNSCDIIWFILIISCLCGGGCGCTCK